MRAEVMHTRWYILIEEPEHLTIEIIEPDSPCRNKPYSSIPDLFSVAAIVLLTPDFARDLTFSAWISITS